MFRTAATQVALRSARPVMMMPVRFASNSSQKEGSAWETAKSEGEGLLGSIKNAGKAWAQDVSKNTENQIHARQTGGKANEHADYFKEAAKDTAARFGNVQGKAQEATSEIKQKAQEATSEIKQKAEEGAEWTKEKAQEGAQWAKSNSGEIKEKAQEGAEWAKGKAQEASSWTQEKIAELKGAAPTAESLIDKAKELAQKTYETVAPAASKAYENMVKPAAAKTVEFAKEQGAVLLEKGKETVSNVASGMFVKTEDAASSVKSAASNLAEGAKDVAQDAVSSVKSAASTTAQGVKEKITPKDQDQPKSSIPGVSRKINIEGEKPFAENEAAQWDVVDSSVQGTKDPRSNKTL